MNRRTFLQRGSFAAIAVSGLPAAVKARKPHQTGAIAYRTTDGRSAAQVLYGVTVHHEAITGFSNATDDQKVIMMGVKQFDTAERTTPAKTGDFKLTIEKVKKVDNMENVWDLTAKVEKMSGTYDLPKDSAKKITLRCKTYSYVNILGKKDAVISEMSYVSASSSSDENCFLTTACVHHKKLTDDCTELRTLRSLREDHMRHNLDGRQLIEQYEILGPSIVACINSLDNRSEIYDYMYQNMILPSVQLVQQGAQEEAVEYYKTFVKALRECYC